MTQPIDVAYVEIVARTQGLRREIKDIIEDDVKDLEKSFDDATKNIDKDFEKTTRVADKSFREISEDGRTSAKKIDDHFGSTFEEIDKHFTRSRTHAHNFFRGLEDDAQSTERNFRRLFFDPLRRGFAHLGVAVGAVGQFIGQLASSIGSLVSSSPLLFLILALIPPIIALAAALGDLLGFVGLIPSGLLVLAAAIAPVVVAFQNFGDAVSALASGDLEKIDAALKKLAPSARVVAREVAGLVEPLRNLQRAVQQSFFTPLIGGFAQLNQTFIPALERGMMRVAAAFGVVFRRVLDFLSLPEQATFIDRLFGVAERLVTRFGPTLIRFLEGFLEVANRALPFLEALGDAALDALGKFGDFMTESARNGDLDTFIQNAITTAKELFSLLGSIFGLFGTLFDATDESGHDLIKRLDDMITRLDDFLKSAQGKDTIDALVLSIQAFGVVLATIIEVLIFLAQLPRQTLRALELLGRGFVGLARKVGEFFDNLVTKIGEFVAKIPSLIAGAFQLAFDVLFKAIGVAIGIGLFIVQELPGRIVSFLLSLPERITQALSGGADVFGTFFQMMIDRGIKILRDGWDGIIAFIKSVPDRIMALGPMLFDAGLNLIKAFMNGFRSANKFIGDIAGDIVSGIKSFINKAIDRINSGIAIVEDFIPGSHLGRIPHLARGGIISPRPGGVLANVGEGGEAEVVSPLSKLKAMIAEVGGGVTFGPGAIVVNLNGATPSLSETRGIGQQLGRGILSIIERTEIQATVRAM